jgi:hypothetical protein
MTKDESKIKDIRSTGRRKGRRALYYARVPFKCVGSLITPVCGKTNKYPPKDAPAFFDEIWPEENRVLEDGLHGLQVDHERKDLMNNEIEHLNWRCPKCHKEADMKTETGKAQKEMRYW